MALLPFAFYILRGDSMNIKFILQGFVNGRVGYEGFPY